MKNKKVLLVVLDGWGHRKERENNAIREANTPNFDNLWDNYPHTLLEASGEAVGLPKGQMGNSEIGHMTIGAGRIIDTDLVRINKSISSKEFHKNPAFIELFDHVRKFDSTIHIKGLIGPGGIHSHSNHLFAFLEVCKDEGINKIAIHAFTDGRDTSPRSAGKYIEELENVIEKIGIGHIATASGRFYAMDRDQNWERLEKAEKAIFAGDGKKHQTRKPSTIINKLYNQDIIDEHIEPIVFIDENGNSYQIQENDGVFFFNFRADRAKMMSQKITEHAKTKNLCFVTMTEYDSKIKSLVAFPNLDIKTCLAKEISKAGFKQSHIAETEKFAHATYFLNAGKEDPYPNESHVLIKSRKDVKTHDMAPKMKSEEITEKVCEEIDKKTDFVFVNYANADMIGHTGNKDALIKSIESLDKEIGRISKKAKDNNYILIITADHGNAEEYHDIKNNTIHTAHTTNKVPFIITYNKVKLKENGTLANIAPTVLEILEIEKPSQMEDNLIR